MTKAQYDEMILKRPSLKPTEIIKAQNTHKTLIGAIGEASSRDKPFLPELDEKPVKSPRTLKFTVLGQPVGKPRMSQRDKWQKRPCVMRYRAWADKARASVPNGVSLGVYRQISFIAYLELPKSYSEAKRELLTWQPHLQKPDLDNILKSIGDSLFPEDRLIWKVYGEKRWDDGAGARIEVELR